MSFRKNASPSAPKEQTQLTNQQPSGDGHTHTNEPPELPKEVSDRLESSLRARFGSFDANVDKIVTFHCPHCGNVYKGTLKECIERMIVDDDQTGEILWRGCKNCWYKLDDELPDRLKLVQERDQLVDLLRFKVEPVLTERNQYFTILSRAVEERDELVEVLGQVVGIYERGGAPLDVKTLRGMLNAARLHKERGDDDFKPPTPYDPTRWTKGLDSRDSPFE